MSERELLEHFKRQRMKAQYYLQRYIDELKLHFEIDDYHLMKILENEIKLLKGKNNTKWLDFFRRI